MSIHPRDPLLTIARIVTWFFIAVIGFAAAAILVAVPFVAFNNATTCFNALAPSLGLTSE